MTLLQKRTIRSFYLGFLAIVAIFGYSCSATKVLLGTKYDYSFALLNEQAKDKKIFDDGKIHVDFFIGRSEVNFVLKNLTSEPMRINWDELSLVINNEGKRVMHNGVKFSEKSSPQAPSTIPPKAQIDDLVLPIENVYYHQDYNATYLSGWKKNDLFLMRDNNKNDVKELIMKNIGKKIQLFFPIEQNGQKLNYNFEFEITDIKPSEKS